MSSVSRRQFCGAIAVGASAVTAAPARRPNIIFILTDDQGYGDVSANGNPILKTPNLDRLHREGVRFEDFHASPTCSPTRASIMTGKHEFKSGVTHTILERERLSLKATYLLPQALRQAGYSTGIFGKWHLGDGPEYQPGRRGFDETFIHGCGGIGQVYPGTCADAPGNSYFNPAVLHNGKFEKTGGYCTDVFFRQATSWIDAKRKQKAPFFAYITPNAPHAPLNCPEDYIAQYRGKVQGENVARFFGMVANIDDNVGRLLGKLSEWGIERDTLVLFMNDNGGTAGIKVFNAGMGETRGKGTAYQGGTRASAFFRWPGTLKPAAVDRLAAHIDLFPTLAELARAHLPAGVEFDGRSLVPLLRNPKAEWKDRYFFAHLGRWPKGKAAESKYATCSVRNQRFSLVNDGKSPKGWELFDLSRDYGETANVIDQHPQEARDLERAYDAWWEDILPCLDNEDAVPPAAPPYHELWKKQFGA